MARKGLYNEWLTPEALLKVEGWARDGLSEKQISHNIGISETTLNDWKKRFPEFLEAIKKGKEVVDYEVENALLKSALDGNVTAQIFWLKHRKPNYWSDKAIQSNPEENEAFDKLITAIFK